MSAFIILIKLMNAMRRVTRPRVSDDSTLQVGDEGMFKLSKLAALAVAAGAALSVQAGEVEVLHYWTSGGEAKSAAELKKMMQAKGHTWRDFAVAGGGGDSAMTVLKSRVVSGNPPSAAQYKGSYVAAPVNVHRVNWLWASSDALKKAGVAAMPKTWDEFFAAADKLKAAGLIPVAHGGQNWQDFTTFESVVLGVGGARFYQDALVKLDDKALGSDTMKKSLETFRRVKSYIDPGSPGRDWNLATAMLIQGKAGFQLMGDWAKGEFVAAGKVPGKDFMCAAAPGTASSFTFNVDSFILFKLKDAAAQKAQSDLAAAIMSPEFQEVFNLNKGSIPVRLGMKMDKFDDCAKLSSKDFVESAKTGGLVPSIAHGMAVAPAAEGAIKDVVSQFWNDDKVSVADAMKKIAQAAKTR